MTQEIKPKSGFASIILVVVSVFFAIAIFDIVRSFIFSADLIFNFSTYAGYMQVPWWIATFYGSELGGTVGGVFLTIAAFLGLYASVQFWLKGSAVFPKIKSSITAALALMAGYYLSLIPTIWLGFVYPVTAGKFWYFEVTPVNEVVFAAGFTSLAMVLVMPPVLLKLRSLVAKNAPCPDIVRWSAITAVAFLFAVFWFNFTMQWTGMLTTWRPIEILGDPFNLLGFATSVFGLLLVAGLGLYAVYPNIKNPALPLNLRRIGATAVALGFYFVLGVFIYFVVGGYYARPMAWYELMVPHNPYLWCVVLLPAGIPLLLMRNRKN